MLLHLMYTFFFKLETFYEDVQAEIKRNFKNILRLNVNKEGRYIQPRPQTKTCKSLLTRVFLTQNFEYARTQSHQ